MTEDEEMIPYVEALSPYCAYAGEVMLVGADWSHQAGHTAKFMFTDSDMEHHPMAEHTTRRGQKAGTRFQIILIELQDDETAVNQDKREVLEKATDTGPKKKTNRIRNAAMLCQDEGFWRYLETLNYVRDSQTNKFKIDVASEYIRRKVGIDSRAALGTDDAAWQRYQTQVVQPFHEWERDNG